MAYCNAPEAIDWLCRVFGFEKHAVYPGPNNTVLHSELTLGGGMIMIGSVMDGPFSPYIKQPDEIGGAETCSINLIVDDADAVYARPRAVKAEILFDIEDKHYECWWLLLPRSGRPYLHIGTYDPWQPNSNQCCNQQYHRQGSGDSRWNSPVPGHPCPISGPLGLPGRRGDPRRVSGGFSDRILFRPYPRTLRLRRLNSRKRCWSINWDESPA